jgi:hypothetical protein
MGFTTTYHFFIRVASSFLFSPSEGDLVVPSLRASTEPRSFCLHKRDDQRAIYYARPTSTDLCRWSIQACLPIPPESSLVDPRMRASNEALPRARVPRAGGQPGCSTLLL